MSKQEEREQPLEQLVASYSYQLRQWQAVANKHLPPANGDRCDAAAIDKLIIQLKHDNTRTKTQETGGEDDGLLCLIKGQWAYFTTQKLELQWGDDWNDAPYEHNAGDPYEPCWHMRKAPCNCSSCQRDWNSNGTPKWEIIKVAWGGPFETPADIAGMDKNYSVEMINEGHIPWLSPCSWVGEDVKPINAGTSLADFIRIVTKAGGYVHTNANPQEEGDLLQVCRQDADQRA